MERTVTLWCINESWLLRGRVCLDRWIWQQHPMLSDGCEIKDETLEDPWAKWEWQICRPSPFKLLVYSWGLTQHAQDKSTSKPEVARRNVSSTCASRERAGSLGTDMSEQVVNLPHFWETTKRAVTVSWNETHLPRTKNKIKIGIPS